MNTRIRTVLHTLLLSTALLCLGCATESDDGPSEMSKMAGAVEQQQAEPKVESKITPPAAPAKEPEIVTRHTPKAGKRLQNSGNYLTAAMSARFTAEHATVFEMQIPKSMQLYQATNGRYPKSHEEFMQNIIKANSIQLPELEDGYEYWYDPTDHELKQRPIKPAGDPNSGPSLIAPQ